MLRQFVAIPILVILVLAPHTPAQAQTPAVNILVLQDDLDPRSLKRNNSIQRAVLTAWLKSLNAPANRELLIPYGITQLGVYDDTAIRLQVSHPNDQRRKEEELAQLAEEGRTPAIHVVVYYRLYAKAVQDHETKEMKLLMSMSYEALDVKSLRFLGGDNIDVGLDGVSLKGCAPASPEIGPDANCVKQLVAEAGARLARIAGKALAPVLMAFLGEKYGSSD